MSSVKKYKYKFSFVMPVYNVEEYLDEALQSILHQKKVNFERDVQIILINDGSPDKSKDVCLKWKERFPNNIVYIEQENSGVSAARNAGMKHIDGEIVSFVDSDDMISSDTLWRVARFLDHHAYIDTPFVAIRQVFFEARQGSHVLSYKFDQDKVIDLTIDFDYPQLSINSTFFRADIVKNYNFDVDVSVSEDMLLVNTLLLDSGMKYGVLQKPVYHYRKRHTGGSAIDGSSKNLSWYTDTIDKVYSGLFDYAKTHQGYLPKFIQYAVAYDLQWRIRQDDFSFLESQVGAGGVKKYKDNITQLIKQLDIDVIFGLRQITREYKVPMMDIAYGGSGWRGKLAVNRNTSVFYDDTKIYNIKNRKRVVIEIVNVKRGKLVIEGHVQGFDMPGVSYEFVYAGEPVAWRKVARPKKDIKILGEIVSHGQGFALELPLGATGDLRCRATVRSNRGRTKGKDLTVDLPIVYTKLSRLVCAEGAGYRLIARKMLVPHARKLQIRNTSTSLVVKKELRTILQLLRVLRLGNIPIVCRLLLLRLVALYHLRAKPMRNIWLISDRPTSGHDNGEALYRYMQIREDIGDVEIRYVMSKKSPDYARLQADGFHLVAYGSLRHWLYTILASKVISSAANDFVTNPFGSWWRFAFGLTQYDFVFLQHGVIHNDLSTWLNKYNKNIRIFVTTTRQEQRSVQSRAYGYDKADVVLTGMPRYDLIEDRTKKIIAIMPTWRKSIGSVLNEQGQMVPNSGFRESRYYEFYESLITNKKLLQYVESHGYKIRVYIHPQVSANSGDFTSSKHCEVVKFPYDYKKIFAESAVFVTDYSSVAFDVAYLGKPLVYTQFDRAEFFKNAVYDEGYFSYVDHGFGPVVESVEDAVEQIIHAADNGVPSLYKKRMERTFAYRDKKNSERIYKAILKLDQNKISKEMAK